MTSLFTRRTAKSLRLLPDVRLVCVRDLGSGLGLDFTVTVVRFYGYGIGRV